MRRAWRIVKQNHADTAFDGNGARLYGGRWNSLGLRLIYTGGSLSLASLEILVHLNPRVSFNYVAIPVDFDPELVETIVPASLPAEWRDEPPPPATKIIGDSWVRQARSAILEVPSVIIPSELNYLINPAHPDFTKIVIGKPQPFSLD